MRVAICPLTAGCLRNATPLTNIRPPSRHGFGKPPLRATAALALVEFAGVVTADRFLGEVLRDQIMAEERDAFYQTVALSTAAEWLNRLAMNELAERSRGGLAMVPSGDDGDAA